MIFSRTVRLTLGRVIVTALLLAHAFDAAYACAASTAAPAMAFSKSDDGGCDDRNTPNTCLHQCAASDRTASRAESPALATPDIAVLTLRREAPVAVSLAVAPAAPQYSTDPPRSIRFCSFQL